MQGRRRAHLLLGAVDRTVGHDLLYRRPVSGVEGQPLHWRHGAGQHLVRLVLKDNRVVAEEKLLLDRKQRIREVRQGPDGYLYIFMGTDLVRLTPKK